MPSLRLVLTPTLLVAGALLFAAESASSQDLHPSRRPSPLGVAKTHLGETYVKVMYGRPYMRGRDIFGESGADAPFLVPYGTLWRLGANEATEITATGPILVAGDRLPAGTYSMFAVPGPDAWTVHFSPQLGMDGTGMLDPETGAFTADVYDPSRDVRVIEAPSVALGEAVEQFTMAFESAADGAVLTMSWERTQVRIPLAPAPDM
jgi:hypothetical protein